MTGSARAAIVIALIAASSAVAGAAIDRVVARRTVRHRGVQGRGSPETDARRRGEMIDRLTHDLELSPAQKSGIDSVMKRTDSSLHAIRTEMQPRLTQVYEQSRTEMLSRLTAGQRVQFEKEVPGRRRVPQ